MEIQRRATGRLFWEQELKRYRQSGISLQEFCRQRGLAYSTATAWAKKLKDQLHENGQKIVEPESLAPIIVSRASNIRQAAAGELTVKIGDVLFEFTHYPHPDWIAQFIQCVKP